MTNPFMILAIQQAKQAMELDEVPVGVVIVSGKEVISTGFNLRETRKTATAHAEIVALKGLVKLWADGILQAVTCMLR